MKNHQIMTLEDANTFVRPLVGEYVWLVRRLEDQLLRMEFGAPRLVIYQPADAGRPSSVALRRRVVTPTGQWTLIIEDGLWVVQAGDLECNRETLDVDTVNRCLDRLNGQRLLSIDISGTDPSLALLFDLGGTLRVEWNVDISGNDQWCFHTEGGNILAYLSPDQIVLETDSAALSEVSPST